MRHCVGLVCCRHGRGSEASSGTRNGWRCRVV